MYKHVYLQDSCFSLLALKTPTNCIGLVQSEHRHRLLEM
jgi:hypothetical protein